MATSEIKAAVYYNGVLAGTLSKMGKVYRFAYDSQYKGRPVSITLPLQKEVYESEQLFPAFTNMLSEGANKKMQSRLLKIDENDYFGLLLATGGRDGIGPVTIQAMDNAPA